MTETCETEALGNEVSFGEEQFHLPRLGVYRGDDRLERKCSFYKQKLGWKGYAANQRGVKNSNVNAKKRKLNVECTKFCGEGWK